MNKLINFLHVVDALMLLQIRLDSGKSSLGYFKVLINSMIPLVFFLAIRVFLRGFTPPHGMSTLSFLAAGFLNWYIFKATLSGIMNTVTSKKTILAFPPVTLFSLVVAKILLKIATYVVSVGLVVAAGICCGVDFRITQTLYLIGSIYLSASLGFGLGVVLGMFTAHLPELKIIISIVIRIMFFISGIFFSVTVFKSRLGEAFLLNPILQHIEMARYSLAIGYDASYFDLPYLLMINIIALTLGMLFLKRAQRLAQG